MRKATRLAEREQSPVDHPKPVEPAPAEKPLEAKQEETPRKREHPDRLTYHEWKEYWAWTQRQKQSPVEHAKPVEAITSNESPVLETLPHETVTVERDESPVRLTEAVTPKELSAHPDEPEVRQVKSGFRSIRWTPTMRNRVNVPWVRTGKLKILHPKSGPVLPRLGLDSPVSEQHGITEGEYEYIKVQLGSDFDMPQAQPPPPKKINPILRYWDPNKPSSVVSEYDERLREWEVKRAPAKPVVDEQKSIPNLIDLDSVEFDGREVLKPLAIRPMSVSNLIDLDSVESGSRGIPSPLAFSSP